MKRILLALALVFIAGSAKATVPSFDVAFINQIESALSTNLTAIDWKIGDNANYTLDMGFIKGTVKMEAMKFEGNGIWLNQDMDLTIQKMLVEILMDKSTGEVLKMIVNGKEQAPPKSDLEVVETRQENITVPAGTFQAIYLKVKDKAAKDAISELWINPKAVPLMGMLKTIQDSQMGKVTLLCTSFRRSP